MEIDFNRDGIDELVFDMESQLDIMDATATQYHHSLTKIAARDVPAFPLMTGHLDSLAFLFHYPGRDSTREELRIKEFASGDLKIAVKDFFVFKGDDRDGNGILDVSSHQKGIITDRTGRELAIIFLLSSEGELLWRKALGGMYTGTWVGTSGSSDNSRKEIIAYRFSLSDKAPSQDIIMRLDPLTGKQIGEARRYGKRFTAFWQVSYLSNYSCFKDLDGDGTEEVIVGNTDGHVRVFDRNLSAIHTSDRVKSPTVIAINDFDGDGIQEVVASTSDNTPIFLAQDLKIMKTVKLPMSLPSAIRIVRGEDKSYVLLMKLNPVPRGPKFFYSLLELKKLPLPLAVVQRERAIWSWALGIAVLTVILVYYRNLLFSAYGRKALFSIFSSAGLDDKMLILKRNGKIVRMGKTWQNFCAIAAPQAESKNDRQVFAGKNCCFVKETLHEMLTQNLREKTSEVVVAQQLAHKIKNPLTSVKLNAEDLRDLLEKDYAVQSPEIQEYFDDIISQVNRLTKMSDRFMRFATFEKLDLQPANINHLLRESIPQWLPEKHARIKTEYELAEDLPDALVDREQFSFVLETVIGNAIESIDSEEGVGTVVTLRLRVAR